MSNFMYMLDHAHASTALHMVTEMIKHQIEQLSLHFSTLAFLHESCARACFTELNREAY